MRHFQDTATGKIWSFDDDIGLDKDGEPINPLSLPSSPKTLSSTIIEKPTGDSVWDNGAWVPAPDNEVALKEISVLEAQITPRRLREAVLGKDSGWLDDVESQIIELRKRI